MSQYKLNVIRESRLLIGILIFSLASAKVIFSGYRGDNLLISITILLLLIGLIYLFSYAKMILKYSNDTITIEWEKGFLFDNRTIEPIKINDITILVVDDNKYLKKIITKDRVVEINNDKHASVNYCIFINRLIELVKNNNGKVIGARQYFWDYNKFFYVFIALTASLAVISKLWIYINFYSLFLLIIPLIMYIKQLRKKTNNTGANTRS